jgi:hypothetical protein
MTIKINKATQQFIITIFALSLLGVLCFLKPVLAIEILVTIKSVLGK